MAQPWTPQEDVFLMQWAPLRSAAQLAKDLVQRFGFARSRSAVLGRARRLGARLAKPAPPPKEGLVENKTRTYRPPIPKRRIVPSPAGRPWPAGPRSAILADLDDDACRFPVGEAEGWRQLFCGEAAEGTAYCPRCEARVRIKGSRLSPEDIELWADLAGKTR